jgi:hypothetical protein
MPSTVGTIFAGKLHFSPATDSTNADALVAPRAAARRTARSTLPMSSCRTRARRSRLAIGCGRRALCECAAAPANSGLRLQLLPLAAGLAAAEAIRTSPA